MFDQANPETPNEVIIEEIKKKEAGLVGLSFSARRAIRTRKFWRALSVPRQQGETRLCGVFPALMPHCQTASPEVDFVCRVMRATSPRSP